MHKFSLVLPDWHLCWELWSLRWFLWDILRNIWAIWCPKRGHYDSSSNCRKSLRRFCNSWSTQHTVLRQKLRFQLGNSHNTYFGRTNIRGASNRNSNSEYDLWGTFHKVFRRVHTFLSHPLHGVSTDTCRNRHFRVDIASNDTLCIVWLNGSIRDILGHILSKCCLGCNSLRDIGRDRIHCGRRGKDWGDLYRRFDTQTDSRNIIGTGSCNLKW